jgi:hypothetical protein
MRLAIPIDGYAGVALVYARIIENGKKPVYVRPTAEKHACSVSDVPLPENM